ncbi:hypothetical protein BG842_00605 [Haladaptatus sp. W1]|nr:hypothetical protein BG842_00605 [Haladaptatus sp. W1]
MRLVYRLTFPAEEIALISPYLRESDSYLEFVTLSEPSAELFPIFGHTVLTANCSSIASLLTE